VEAVFCYLSHRYRHLHTGPGNWLTTRAEPWSIHRAKGTVTWIVYILECADNSLYTGITKNLDRRIAEHAAGKGAKYTKGRGPFRLVYRETCEGRAEASRRETTIKSLDRGQKRLLCS
jgi:putative endonuclease